MKLSFSFHEECLCTIDASHLPSPGEIVVIKGEKYYTTEREWHVKDGKLDEVVVVISQPFKDAETDEFPTLRPPIEDDFRDFDTDETAN